MKKTVAYYRSSTKLQEESVDAQRANIRRYAQERGILIDGEYPEPFVSARKNKLRERPEMKRLMTDIRNQKVGKLLVYKRDRLARKVEEHLELYKLLKQHQVEVHFIAENEPPMQYDVFGELMELFIGVMSQREGEQISSNIRDKKVNNFLEGNSVGNLPFGYKANDTKTEIKRNEDELKIVKKIYDLWNQETYEYYKTLGDELNQDGKFKREKQWTGASIKAILTNPIYMGLRIANYDSKSYSLHVNHLAVINKEDFQKAQSLIEKRKPKSREKENFQYLLSGLIKCEGCLQEHKESMLKESKKSKQKVKYPTYECKRHKNKINAGEIEDHVYEEATKFFKQLLETHFEDLYKSQLKTKLKEIENCKTEYESKLEKAEEKLIKATSKWIENESVESSNECTKHSKKIALYKEKLFELNSKKHQYRQVPDFVKEIKNDFLTTDKWDQLDFDDKKDLLNDLIHEILVNDVSVKITFKHPFLESNEVRI